MKKITCNLATICVEYKPLLNFEINLSNREKEIFRFSLSVRQTFLIVTLKPRNTRALKAPTQSTKCVDCSNFI